MKAKMLSCVTVLAAALLLFPSCKKKAVSRTFRTIDEIKASGELRIAAYSDRPPVSWTDETWEYHGFYVYFARQLADDLGVTPVFSHVKPAELAEIIETGAVDVGASFAEIPERSDRVAYTLPYMKTYIAVMSPVDDLITSLDELEGKRLIVEAGTVSERYFSIKHPDVTLVKVAIAPQIFQALRLGRGDAIAATYTSLKDWVANNPDYEVGIESVGNPIMIAACVHKDNSELLQWINEDMVELGKRHFFRDDYEATLRKTLGEDADPDDQVIEDWK